jgi:hypothetical protein
MTLDEQIEKLSSSINTLLAENTTLRADLARALHSDEITNAALIRTVTDLARHKAVVDVARTTTHGHTDACYDPYEVCGEHHRHSDTCGSRPLWCRKREGPRELLAALAAFDAAKSKDDR